MTRQHDSLREMSSDRAPAAAAPAGTILWLPGWGMDTAAFDGLRTRLPQFRHAAVPLGGAGSPEQLRELAASAALGLSPAAGAEILRPGTAAARKAPPLPAHAADRAPESAALSADPGPGARPLLAAGWSLGGLIALELASEGRIDGLVLLGATARFVRPRGETSLGWPDAYVRQMAAALKQNRETVEERFRASMFTSGEKERGFPALLPPSRGWADAGLLAGLELLREADARPLLTDISCPVLIIHGTADAVCPFGAALELHERLPDAKLAEVPDGGHAPFIGREPSTAESIWSWWNDKQSKHYPKTI